MKIVRSLEFEKEVLQQEGLVLVDFFTEWCGYCELLVPELQQASEALPEVKFVKVNAEASSDVAEAYHIEFYPEMLLFKGGKVVGHIDGYVKKDQIIRVLKEYL
ncbi:MAG: thioredoxin [Prevotella sp.]|nr:thioredoxin [Staphylococcus sp.]MCM1350270.1 thioredoxin [Prevotella sp.]